MVKEPKSCLIKGTASLIYTEQAVPPCHQHIFLTYQCCLPTWSLTLREEYRLRLFENRVLRRILRPKRDEVTGGWRKLHNEELRDLYSLPNIITIIKSRRMRWVGHVARMEEKRNAYGLLV
jgi:hypothetical protein